MQERIRQINIDGRLTGVVGLDEAISQAAKSAGKDEDTIINEILNHLARKNYIPAKRMPAYRKAIIREYRVFQGQPVEEEELDGLRVVILGAGCFQCTSLENLVRNVMAEKNLSGDILHITDPREIGRYGVMGTPALVINNKVVSVGVVPDQKKIQGWLDDAVKGGGAKSSG